MRKRHNPMIEKIIQEENLRQKYQNYKRGGKTLAQFQLQHCRYCKNKDTDLCEIRRDINNDFRCEFEENIYERRNIE